MPATIARWGNSTGVRIPADVLPGDFVDEVADLVDALIRGA